jgi:lysyl-tRNA synthetase class 2
LGTIKSKSGLSNKKWDKTLKSLRKHKIIDVFKDDEIMKIKAV